MKRVAAWFIIACIMMSLVGCSNSGTPSPSPDPSSSSSTESSPSVEPTETQTTLASGETDIIINPGEWQLSGTLTMPEGEGQFPLVVFVHGSGPADSDETIGKIKVFKDLATDLVKQGIASVRYDKRSYLYGQKMATDLDMTVKEETVDDVLNAVAFAQTTENIDTKNIFVAGHSMGGYLIPRIDKADSENSIAGYISLAGSVRPMMDLMLEQIDYILSFDTATSEADKAAYKKQFTDANAVIKSLTDSDKGTNQAVLGAYPSYWVDLANYKPDIEITDVKEPLLFLQGGHDYQVTSVDFELWKTGLEGRDNAQFKLYPNLTHSFTSTENMGTPSDYQVYAKVDEAVSKDIADFVNINLNK